MRRAAALACGAALVLAGCGQKGALYLPEQKKVRVITPAPGHAVPPPATPAAAPPPAPQPATPPAPAKPADPSDEDSQTPK
jgi:predicted small lipoprotein YifL